MSTQQYQIHPLTEEEILAVYTELAPLHFPAGELRPLSNIRELLGKKSYEGLGIYKDGAKQLLGYALFLRIPGTDTALLDFYAILAQYRSLGLGSIFLQEIRAYYRHLSGILLETEDPEFAENESQLLERNRRNAFYYKNGAHLTGVKCTLFGVPFQILFLPTGSQNELFTETAESREVIRQRLDCVYHFMLSEERYNQGVYWR